MGAWELATIAFVLLAFSAVSRRLERSVVTAAIFFTSAGTALLAAGIATGLGGSIFIAAFTGGFLFGVVGRDNGGDVWYLVDEGGELLNAVTFIVFGAAILGPVLDDLGWEVLVYALLSLTVVRMLPVALALLGSGHAGRRSRSWVGSVRVGSRRSCSP